MTTLPEKPRTCVIGAGVAGLPTVKALRDWGIPHTCFEASDDIGGNWYFRNPNGRSSAYRSLHIDTSKNSVSFRDLPIAERYPDYLHHEQILEYLHEYAEAFALRENIRFDTRVQHAERLPGGGWRVELESGESERFDALLVANGHHWDPAYPDPPFPGHFDGETLHSHHYIDATDPIDFVGRRVVVVGIGNSAVDIASELSRKGTAEAVFISTRSGAWVMPKYLFGRPIDQIVRTVPWIPGGLQRRLARVLPRLASGRMEDFGLPRPDHNFLEAHPTLSSELLLRLGSGDLVAKPNITELMGDRVRFEDGSVERVDAIVYATGYRITFPFFDPDFISAPRNRFPLYKRMFRPGIDDLAFIGFAQAIPTLFPFTELQGRLAGRWLAGDWAPPSQEEMEREIAEDERRMLAHFSERPRHTMQVDFYVYEWDLERRVIPAGRERAARGEGSRPAPREQREEAAVAA